VIEGSAALVVDTDVSCRLIDAGGAMVSGAGVDGGTLTLDGLSLGFETGLNTALPFSAKV
jgi:hypothetical protein